MKRYTLDKLGAKDGEHIKISLDKCSLWNNVNFCKLKIQQGGLFLRYVKPDLQTEELCKLAVQQNGLALVHVNLVQPAHVPNNNTTEIYQTEEICMCAVKQNGMALSYVKLANALPQNLIGTPVHQTYEICKAAVKQNHKALIFVQGLNSDPIFSSKQINELCELAVKQDGYMLQHIPRQLQTYRVCALAVKQNGLAFELVEFSNFSYQQMHEISKLAINQNSGALRYVNLRSDST